MNTIKTRAAVRVGVLAVYSQVPLNHLCSSHDP